MLSLGLAIATIQGALHLTDAEFLAKPWSEREGLIATAAPFLQPMNWINYGWLLCEMVVFLRNQKRRALHDFIAGTVVVFAENEAAATATPAVVAGKLPAT